MSKLQELIKELCPEGVEFRKLGKVCEILDSKRQPIAKGKRIPGKYPYYGANGVQDYVDNYIFDGVFLLVGEDGSVINKDNSPVLNWAVGKIWVNNHAHILAEKNCCNLRYLYFILQVTNVSKIVRGMPPKINQENLINIEIPLPPLEVQNEIVRILDAFTSHAAELQANLQAELQTRKEQYEYYRNKLLTFYENDEGVKWMKLGDLFDFKNGLNKGKEFFGKGSPIVNFTDVYNKRALYKETLKGKVEVDSKETLRYNVHKGDVFFTRTSETPNDIGMSSVMMDEVENCVFSGFVLRGRPRTQLLLPKYCAYCFSTNQVRKEIVRNSSYTTRALTSGTNLSKISIPVPPLSEQQRIVSILDKFESLVNDLSEGLPAEIAAVQEQYEYYRNKLLTFKRKS